MARASRTAHNTVTLSPLRLSIRVRLVLLALLAIVPLTLDRVRLLEASRTERIEMASADVLDLARRGANAQIEMINSTRAVLEVVARAYITLVQNRQSCNGFLAGFATDVPWIKGLSAVGPNGRIICSTRPLAVGIDVSDRPYIQEARRSWGFVLSDYLIQRVDDQPAIIAAYPVMGKDETVDAVILAPVDLQWVGHLTSLIAQRSGATAMLIDSRGTVVAAIPEREQTGKDRAHHPLVRQVLARPEGTVTTAGFDGVRRIFAFTRLPENDGRIVVGVDEHDVLSRVDREIRIAYLQLALFGLFTLVAAWFGGEHLIVRPIRALARTATLIGRGDLDARPNRENWAAEFAPLAAALTDMAVKLSERDRELRSANRHLEALATIDSLSGLANRRSFDARLATEWQRAAALGRPIALMMIDVDHFKMFNDTYGHLEGDDCLRRIGKALGSAIGDDAGLVARYGGEEFVLLLPGTPLDRALHVAERLRAAVAGLGIEHRGAPRAHVTVSIGVACLVPRKDSSPQSLIEAADAGLYAAKRAGRDTVCIDPPALVPAD
jgi:diguanylate cyclase (GGDEF)-like protein